MSTRCTIAHDDSFHLYEEAWTDDDAVYLELEGPDVRYEAAPGSVMVRIPPHVWEVIRRSGGPNLLLAEETDEAIRAHVVEAVTKRVADYAADPRGLAALSGLLSYGSVEDPPEAQIERGVADLTKARERQRAVKAKVDAIMEAKR